MCVEIVIAAWAGIRSECRMARKLEVYRTPIAFHDAHIAASR